MQIKENTIIIHNGEPYKVTGETKQFWKTQPLKQVDEFNMEDEFDFVNVNNYSVHKKYSLETLKVTVKINKTKIKDDNVMCTQDIQNCYLKNGGYPVEVDSKEQLRSALKLKDMIYSFEYTLAFCNKVNANARWITKRDVDLAKLKSLNSLARAILYPLDDYSILYEKYQSFISL
jgi:hypothetical protein